MSLSTDKFFAKSLRASDVIVDAVDGRIFNTSREEIDEEEDKIPYIIISHDGTQNEADDKDTWGEGDSDIDTISVLVVERSREELAELAEGVRKVLQTALEAQWGTPDESMGFVISGYEFSGSRVEMDIDPKTCYYQTLTYRCSTYNIVK